MSDGTGTQLGTLAVKNGFASPSEIELALDVQKQADPEGNPSIPRLGEILLEMGTIDPQKLDALLVEQNVLRAGVEDREAGAAPAEEAPPSESPVVVPKVEETPPKEGLAKLAGRALLRALGVLFRKLLDRITGKRAREKAAAVEKRDALLLEIARAALAAKTPGPEAEGAVKAAARLEEARKKAAGEDTIANRNALKLAETKDRMSLVKLARLVVDKGPVPEGTAPKIEEVRALEVRIKELA